MQELLTNYLAASRQYQTNSTNSVDFKYLRQIFLLAVKVFTLDCHEQKKNGLRLSNHLLLLETRGQLTRHHTLHRRLSCKTPSHLRSTTRQDEPALQHSRLHDQHSAGGGSERASEWARRPPTSLQPLPGRSVRGSPRTSSAVPVRPGAPATIPRDGTCTGVIGCTGM